MILIHVVRTLVYGSLFIGFLLVYLPAILLTWSGFESPAHIGVMQVAGGILAAAGLGLAIWCALTFAIRGRGTPAPFDPPTRLVTSGPYLIVRNPMYIGAGAALAGAAVFYASWWLAAYAAGFMLFLSLFVVGFEEPWLHARFGDDYRDYCREVNRWIPLPRRRS